MEIKDYMVNNMLNHVIVIVWMSVPKQNNGIWRHNEFLNYVETNFVCQKMDIKKC